MLALERKAGPSSQAASANKSSAMHKDLGCSPDSVVKVPYDPRELPVSLQASVLLIWEVGIGHTSPADHIKLQD